MAVLGVDQPVPIVVAKVENGQMMPTVNWCGEKKFGTYPFDRPGSGEKVRVFESDPTINYYRSLLHTPAMFEVVANFVESKYSRDVALKRNLNNTALQDFKEYLFRRISDKWNQTFSAIVNPPLTLESNPTFINFQLDHFSGYDFDGYAAKQIFTFNK